MTWEELPRCIQLKMLDEQEAQGHTRNEDIFKKALLASTGGGGFWWHNAPQGEIFWTRILSSGHIDHFFTKYPKNSKEIVELTEHESMLLQISDEFEEVLYNIDNPEQAVWATDMLVKDGHEYLNSAGFIVKAVCCKNGQGFKYLLHSNMYYVDIHGVCLNGSTKHNLKWEVETFEHLDEGIYVDSNGHIQKIENIDGRFESTTLNKDVGQLVRKVLNYTEPIITDRRGGRTERLFTDGGYVDTGDRGRVYHNATLTVGDSCFRLPEKWFVRPIDAESDRKLMAWRGGGHINHWADSIVTSAKLWVYSDYVNLYQYEEISYEQFRRYVLNELPERWCIRQDASQEACDWFNSTHSSHARSCGKAQLDGAFRFITSDGVYTNSIPNGCIEITAEEFTKSGIWAPSEVQDEVGIVPHAEIVTADGGERLVRPMDTPIGIEITPENTARYYGTPRVPSAWWLELLEQMQEDNESEGRLLFELDED